MVVVLIRWMIKKDYEEKFVHYWEQVSKVSKGKGLLRETLTRADGASEDSSLEKLNSWNMTSPFYSTFINVGIWNSARDFEDVIGKSISSPEEAHEGDKRVFKVALEEFEYKLRERKILAYVSDRGSSLPPAKLSE